MGDAQTALFSRLQLFLHTLTVLFRGHAHTGLEGTVVTRVIHKSALKAGIFWFCAAADHFLGKKNPPDHAEAGICKTYLLPACRSQPLILFPQGMKREWD